MHWDSGFSYDLLVIPKCVCPSGTPAFRNGQAGKLENASQYFCPVGETYSTMSLLGRRRIYLGTEVFGLDQSAFTFVVLHEIAHITATRAHVRSLESLMLRLFEALNELRSKNSPILLRRVPKFGSSFRVMRSIFTAPEDVGILYFPMRWIAAVLGLAQSVVPILLGPHVRTEELYADCVAARKRVDDSSKQ